MMFIVGQLRDAKIVHEAEAAARWDMERGVNVENGRGHAQGLAPVLLVVF